MVGEVRRRELLALLLAAGALLACGYAYAADTGTIQRTSGVRETPASPFPTGKQGKRRVPRFCARGVCWTAWRWSTQSLRNHQRARRLEHENARLRHQLAQHRTKLRTLQARRLSKNRDLNTDWRARQIAAAETIARESAGDPWPHCPDPYDGSGASWDDTVRCENSGNWLDSPGWHRCGLQFMPSWETRFGRLCP